MFIMAEMNQQCQEFVTNALQCCFLWETQLLGLSQLSNTSEYVLVYNYTLIQINSQFNATMNKATTIIK